MPNDLAIEFPRGSMWRHYRNGKTYRVLRHPTMKNGTDVRLVEYAPTDAPADDDPFLRTPDEFRRSFTIVGSSER